MAIYHMTTRTGKAHQGRAVRHGSYIRRAGLYADRNDIAAHEYGNMPAWANDNPAEFWQACDTLERSNGRAYREIELALPRELDRNQQIELVRQYVREQLGQRHAYEWSVHDKGDGNPHAHVMFSERMLDGMERDREQFFKRANSKNPERGGCAKDDGWRGTKYDQPERLLEARARWAELQNMHLERAGELARVDHRSLEAQGIEREAQIHVGPVAAQGEQIHAERYERNEAIKLVNQEAQVKAELAQAEKGFEAAQAELKQITATLEAAKARTAETEKGIEDGFKDVGKSFDEMRAMLQEMLAKQKQDNEKAAELKEKAETKAEERQEISSKESRLIGGMTAGGHKLQTEALDKGLKRGHVTEGREDAVGEALEQMADAHYARREAEKQAQEGAEASRAAEVSAQQQKAPQAQQKPQAHIIQASYTPSPATTTAREETAQAEQSTGSGLGPLKRELAHGEDETPKPVQAAEVTKNEPATVADLDKLEALRAERAAIEAERSQALAASAEYERLKKTLSEPQSIRSSIETERNWKRQREEKVAELSKGMFSGFKNRKDIEVINKQIAQCELRIKEHERKLAEAEARTDQIKAKMAELEPKRYESQSKDLMDSINRNKVDAAKTYDACIKKHGIESVDARLQKSFDGREMENLKRSHAALKSQEAAAKKLGKVQVSEITKDRNGNTVSKNTYDRGR